ncbi:hypothetical protein B9Z65_8605 [Elsinoe australis]|uniref:Uncharacterized protein n=1 Tax=Elsinoe australis TaxID=40998 RepID=A0A2P7YE96_9PEZI|nr:hypothetical protein B9Z65_8605 [Elsinoe australis]
MGEDGVHFQPAETERKDSTYQQSSPSSTTQPLDSIPDDAHEFKAFSRAQTSVDIEDYFY